jgi:hypothetical protein
MVVTPAPLKLHRNPAHHSAPSALTNAAIAIAQLEQPQAQSGFTQTFGTDQPRLWTILKKRFMQEICGEDESFRSLIKDIKKSPSNAIAVTAAITYLVNLSGFPIPIEP